MKRWSCDRQGRVSNGKSWNSCWWHDPVGQPVPCACACGAELPAFPCGRCSGQTGASSGGDESVAAGHGTQGLRCGQGCRIPCAVRGHGLHPRATGSTHLPPQHTRGHRITAPVLSVCHDPFRGAAAARQGRPALHGAVPRHPQHAGAGGHGGAHAAQPDRRVRAGASGAGRSREGQSRAERTDAERSGVGRALRLWQAAGRRGPLSRGHVGQHAVGP